MMIYIKKPHIRTILLAYLLEFSLQLSDNALTAKVTYKLAASYRQTTTVFLNATNPLDTGAGVTLIHSAMILAKWHKRVKREKLPTLLTARMQPLPIEGLILPVSNYMPNGGLEWPQTYQSAYYSAHPF